MFAGTNPYEVAWRRERLMASARPRKESVTLRQRAGLQVVHLGLAIAGRLTVTTVAEMGTAAAPQT